MTNLRMPIKMQAPKTPNKRPGIEKLVPAGVRFSKLATKRPMTAPTKPTTMLAMAPIEALVPIIIEAIQPMTAPARITMIQSMMFPPLKTDS